MIVADALYFTGLFLVWMGTGITTSKNKRMIATLVLPLNILGAILVAVGIWVRLG